MAQFELVSRPKVDEYWNKLRGMDANGESKQARANYIRESVLSIAIMERAANQIYDKAVDVITSEMSERKLTILRVDDKRTLVLCKAGKQVHNAGWTEVVVPKVIQMPEEKSRELEEWVNKKSGTRQKMLGIKELYGWLNRNFPKHQESSNDESH